MTPRKNKNYALLVLAILLLTADIYLFSLDLETRHKGLTFAMLNVGQGDALYIESPTGAQVLFDSGSPGKILGPLSRIMSPFDKTIDAVVITNPDADHIGGFADILKNYKVGAVFEPGTANDSETYKNLHELIKEKNIPDVLAKKGMRLDLGGGVAIDILFPDRNVFDWTSNDGSVVARLNHGTQSITLMGDATMKTEEILLAGNSLESLKSTVLKVGHHGSKTSTSMDFAKAVSPSYALVSLGANNRYGHPHQQTLDTLNKIGAQIFRTDLLGTIIIRSDGQNIAFSFNK